jgi:hypothetical protein
MSQTIVSEEEILTLPRVNIISGGVTHTECRLKSKWDGGTVIAYVRCISHNQNAWTPYSFPAAHTIVAYIDESVPRSKEK